MDNNLSMSDLYKIYVAAYHLKAHNNEAIWIEERAIHTKKIHKLVDAGLVRVDPQYFGNGILTPEGLAYIRILSEMHTKEELKELMNIAEAQRKEEAFSRIKEKRK